MIEKVTKDVDKKVDKREVDEEANRMLYVMFFLQARGVGVWVMGHLADVIPLSLPPSQTLKLPLMLMIMMTLTMMMMMIMTMVMIIIMMTMMTMMMTISDDNF